MYIYIIIVYCIVDLVAHSVATKLIKVNIQATAYF